MKITRKQLIKIIKESFEGKPGEWKYDVVSIGKYDDVSALTPEDIKSVRVKVSSGPSNVGKEFPLSTIEGNEGLENYKSHPLVTQVLDAIKNNKGLEGVKIQTPEEMKKDSKPSSSSGGSSETPSSTSSLEGGGFIKVTPSMLTSAVSGISNDCATYALSSFRKHYSAGKIKNNHKMIIVDYTIPGSDTRLWCVEVNEAGDITTRASAPVAHGSGDSAPGSAPASKFSNTPNSNTASVGSFVTSKRYKSGAGVLYKYASSSDRKNLSKSELKKKYKGLAMRFKGLDSTNSNDLKRAIVIHGASYRDRGKTGKSHGCLATSRENNEKIINFLGLGTFGYKFGGKNNADKVDTSWITSLKEGYKIKITRRQLRKIILKEFRQTGQYDDFDFGAGTGGGQLPPVQPPRRGGGGGGDGYEPRGFGGRGSNPCDFGNPKSDMYYDRVFNTFGPWIESTFPMTQQGDTAPDQYLQFLEMNYPDFSMDLVSDNYNEFFELIMTIIAEFACKRNIEDLTSIYRNPMSAIRSF